jgi:flagellar basal-body rod modification protein FlgD
MFMSPISSSQIDAYNAKGGAQGEASDPQAAQDRFMKLFVAQLNNQDPLNPLDNAQMTSQMAQINTVTGIQQVNDTLKGLAAQFGKAQTIGGASLVGRQVIAQGNSLSIKDGVAQGSFNLNSPADSVRIDVMDAAGQVLGTVNTGAKTPGLHNFEWALAGVDPERVAGFQINATTGGQPVAATPLARQRVESVGMVEGGMRLRTENGGTLGYEQILAFL